MYRLAFGLLLMCGAVGCSSLGLSLSPPQNNLTDNAEAVLNATRRQVELPRELAMSVLVAHYLQPGDVLIVEPVELDSQIRFSTDQKVLADGTIDLGKFGRVIVAGLTLEMAENHIEGTLVNAGEKATQINVRLLDPVQRIYVLGEVASPGSYPFAGNETVLDGILTAGGLTTKANACKIILARPTMPESCRVALPICYKEITQLGDTTTNYQLQPGDRIFVASRSFCDDLQFWKANQTCERCCKCQRACPDPSIATFNNPISPNLPAPPVAPVILPTKPGSNSTTSSKQRDQESRAPLPSPSIQNLFESPEQSGNNQSSAQDGQLEFDADAFSKPKSGT